MTVTEKRIPQGPFSALYCGFFLGFRISKLCTLEYSGIGNPGSIGSIHDYDPLAAWLRASKRAFLRPQRLSLGTRVTGVQRYSASYNPGASRCLDTFVPMSAAVMLASSVGMSDCTLKC